MPVSYRIDSDSSIVRVELSGALRAEEVRRTVDELLADPAVGPGIHLLSDHSQLCDAATTPLVKEVISLLKRIGERVGPFKCAVVVTRDVSFGMARMAEAYADGTAARVRAFRAMAQAEAWLHDEPAAGRARDAT